LSNFLLTVTHLRANPEHHNDGEYCREEVRADIRIFRTNYRAVQQYAENKTGSCQTRQAYRHSAIKITLMQAVNRQHQGNNREYRKWHNGAKQRCESTINR